MAYELKGCIVAEAVFLTLKRIQLHLLTGKHLNQNGAPNLSTDL